MTYSLEFEEHALKEFKKLAPVLRDQFKKTGNSIRKSLYSRQ